MAKSCGVAIQMKPLCQYFQMVRLVFQHFAKIKWEILSKFDFSHFCKITKIVRTLWLAKRSVCMRVCKHGCDVKMFCFSRANHGSTSLKKYLSSKLDKFTLFTHSFVGWNLEHLYKQAVSILFSFKLTKSVFWTASFCKTSTDYACKPSCTQLCDW